MAYRTAAKEPLRWAECRRDGRCLITGGDALHEWMLPWWYENARRHCGLPVVFIDLGLSPRALAWCRARGEVVRGSVPAANAFVAKPLGIIQNPYAECLWADLDCEILEPVEPVFEETFSEIGVAGDVPGALDPVQAGVVVVRHGSATALEWAELCRDWRKLDRSRIPTRHKDQSLLGHLWTVKPEAFTLLGEKWNRSRMIPDTRAHEAAEKAMDGAAIVHWWGLDGKAEIRRRVAACPPGDPRRALERSSFPIARRAWAEFRRRGQRPVR